MASETKEKTKRRSPRNFKAEIERLRSYLDIIIRVKAPDDVDDTHTGDFLKGQLKAYRDVKSYMEEAS